MQFREPIGQDWESLLDLANKSVADIEGAGTQGAWLLNRQTFATNKGAQYHFVCTDSGQVVGYGSAEHAWEAPDGEYRLFVVTKPEDLDSVGELVVKKLQSFLSKAQARRTFFVEFAKDFTLAAFVQRYGYDEVRRFTLESGAEAVVSDSRHTWH